MGIKRNTEVLAEVLAVKASRLQAIDRAEQAERLLRMDEARPATTKVKKGKQSLRGRTRVERARRPEVITAKRILELENMLADMATREILEDERGHTRFEHNTRWGYPSVFVAGFVGFYSHVYAKYISTVQGLMAFEAELYYGGVLPRGYVTPDEIVRVTGRQLGK